MIHTVTLSPIDTGSHSTMLDGKFFDKKQRQTIILTVPYGVAVDRPLTPNEKKWIQWFKPNQPAFSITWNDDNESEKNVAKFVEYLKKHDFVKCDGNYNQVPNPQFKLVDSRQVHVERAAVIKNKLLAANLINNMKASEMTEVAFFMGSNPSRKTTEEIFVDLCDFDEGLIMKNPSKFLAEWQMPDRSHIVYARKAIDLHIIKLDNGIYKLNNASIGAGIDDVVVYLKTNVDVYENFIKKEVHEKDTLPLGLNEDVKVSSILNKEKKVSSEPLNGKKSDAEKAQNKADREASDAAALAERKEWVGKLVALKVSGAHLADSANWSIEVIKKKVLEAEAKAKVTA